MKRIMKAAAFVLVLVLGSAVQQKLSAQYDDDYSQGNYDGNYDTDRDVSYQTFYDELSPHGRWVDYPGHGYVWVPDAGPDFRPYSTNGHWVWSDQYEWTWVSDYDWGWAPFHYGRWDNDPVYGWYWVPGYEWSPAWVAWRDGGDYYGWAPIRPGISINVNFNIGGYAPPVNFWVFSPRRYITSPRLYDYCVDPRRNVTIINYTTIISNNYRYNRNYGFSCGPRRYDAERHIGRINPVRIRQTYNPGRTTFRNNEVSIYRPNVRRDANRTIAPRRFDRYESNGGNRVTTRNENGGFRNTDRNGGFRNTDRNGGFRNNDRNTEVVRQQQQQQQNTGNDSRRFERNNDDVIRQHQQQQNERKRFDRNNEVVRQQQQQQEERKRFERNNEVVRQQQQQEERKRFERNNEVVRQQQQQQEERKRFERNNEVIRQQQQQQQQQQNERKRFERNNDVVRQQQSQQERPRQFERREERVQQQQQPQQQRQFERRDNGSRPENGGGNGKGNGERSSKKRF